MAGDTASCASSVHSSGSLLPGGLSYNGYRLYFAGLELPEHGPLVEGLVHREGLLIVLEGFGIVAQVPVGCTYTAEGSSYIRMFPPILIESLEHLEGLLKVLESFDTVAQVPVGCTYTAEGSSYIWMFPLILIESLEHLEGLLKVLESFDTVVQVPVGCTYTAQGFSYSRLVPLVEDLEHLERLLTVL